MSTPSVITGTMADPLLLNKIDKLALSGVGEYISLPQLVVVGDQSSGKSSVLEGLTNLPFPRDSGLCTRFATKITFRRAQETKISISIIPGNGSSVEHQQKVKSWTKPNLKELTAKAFADIMKEVHEIMELSSKDSKTSQNTFSDDVLRLEVCGPKQEHFSVIDVPGIFRKTTEGLTTKQDQEMVRSMVRWHMNNPRSVMLTVVPANVDIATQEILTMAEEADKKGERTLGVLTKPDLVDLGAEEPVVSLVKGEKHKLTLGWCIVRNPGQIQLQNSSLDRGAIEEQFFRDMAPWNTLDKDRVGISALRVRLKEVLADNIRREFPKVKSEILKKLSNAKQEVERLGAKRETPMEQRRYLLDLSSFFQRIVNFALSANYVGSDWFDDYPCLRFATAVVNRNELFARVLEFAGHSYAFNYDQDCFGLFDAEPELDIEPELVSESEPGKMISGGIRIRSQENLEGLEELTTGDKTIQDTPKNGIYEWLTQVYKTSRGFELGTFDGTLLAMTMKRQSSNWEKIAMGYTKDVITMTHKFILELLRLICPDTRVREGLISSLMDKLLPKYEKALEIAHFLLSVERSGTPSTLNHYFNDNLEKSRKSRLRIELKEKSFVASQHGEVIRLTDISGTHPMSNVKHVVREIHDILESYYKVARKRFVDNMSMQAVDHYLVQGPDAPLKLFSPSFVDELTEDQLMEIAGEDALLKRKRAALNKEIANLEAGKKVL